MNKIGIYLLGGAIVAGTKMLLMNFIGSTLSVIMGVLIAISVMCLFEKGKNDKDDD